MTTTIPELITAPQINAATAYHVSTPSEVAAMLGVSETTVRRQARRLGVVRIAGRTVAGAIRWSHTPYPVIMTVARLA